MYHLIEIKAHCSDHNRIRNLLQANNADFKGVDHQTDTYFNVNEGRLKLREGNIENNLIHYNRENKGGPKHSEVTLYKSTPDSTLKETLTKALGVKVVVAKKREIYFIENVKFHIDIVDSLGSFIEIEAIGNSPKETAQLKQQCDHYIQLFEVKDEDLITHSYSDLLLNKNPG